ncbi:MAG: NAD-dependent epimerase/dehydratase family protein [Gammaproteobacteria bacterium]|nr:NAD-dependent epimerase/dehydratase family protein [Gammaproteobacteria bacterium]
MAHGSALSTDEDAADVTMDGRSIGMTAVTGVSGFVGGALLQALSERAVPLRLLVRRPLPIMPAGAIRHCGDLTEPASLQGFLDGVDTLFHLAGYAHAVSTPDPAELERHRHINLEGTQNLFRCAAEGGVRRLVFVSSVKAGSEDAHACLNEHSMCAPTDPYGRIKREIEDWLLEQGARRGVEISVLRPALVYGPGVKGNLAAMLRAIDRGSFPPVPETHNVRSMVSVQDLVAALLAAGTRAEAAGQVCIVDDGEAYSTRRIYTSMAAALGRPVPAWSVPAGLLRALGRVGDLGERLLRRRLPFNGTLAARLLDSACYRSVQAEVLLGFEPRYRLEDVLPDMVHVYRNRDSGFGIRDSGFGG